MVRGMRATVFFIGLLLFNHAVYAGYGSQICNSPPYECYKVQRGDSWNSLFPDDGQRDLIMRINRMNTRLHPGMRIAVPSDPNNLDPATYSPFPLQISPPGSKTIIVSLSDLAFGAYDYRGTLQYWGPVSGGKGYCPDVHRGCHSPSGRFAIYHKQGAGCFSTKYPVGKGGAKMPYCMFFHGGYALHGSYEVPGYNASHGCVRMFIGDAKWLNEEFTGDGERTLVVIHR